MRILTKKIVKKNENILEDLYEKRKMLQVELNNVSDQIIEIEEEIYLNDEKNNPQI